MDEAAENIRGRIATGGKRMADLPVAHANLGHAQAKLQVARAAWTAAAVETDARVGGAEALQSGGLDEETAQWLKTSGKKALPAYVTALRQLVKDVKAAKGDMSAFEAIKVPVIKLNANAMKSDVKLTPTIKKLSKELLTEFKSFEHAADAKKELKKELHKELDKELNKELNKELKKELKKELNEDLNKELHKELKKELKKEFNKELKKELKKKLKKECKKELNKELNKELHKELKKDFKKELNQKEKGP